MMNLLGNERTDSGIELAYMVDRILAAASFHAHVSSERDDPVVSVTSSDNTLVAAFDSASAQCEVIIRFGRIVPCIERNRNIELSELRHHQLLDDALQELQLLEVEVLTRGVGSDKRNANSDVHSLFHASGHHFDIHADIGIEFFELLPIQRGLNEHHDLLGGTERTVRYCRRGIVRAQAVVMENRKLFLRDLEEELAFILCRSISFVHDTRAGCEVRVIHDHEPLVQIEKWQNISKVLVDRILDDLKIRDGLLLPSSGEPTVEIKPDGLLHFTTTEFDLCRAARQSDLVDHVSQDDAVAFQAVLRVCLGHLLGDCVAERVRMADALAFDDLEFGVVDFGRSRRVDEQVCLVHVAPPLFESLRWNC